MAERSLYSLIKDTVTRAKDYFTRVRADIALERYFRNLDRIATDSFNSIISENQVNFSLSREPILIE